jgi:hypothetical protein
MPQNDVVPLHGGDIIEQVITKGDLARLTPQERVQYYKSVCDSVGLNPLTRPLEFITLSGRLVLYARRDAADQLRKINGISVEVVSQKVDGDMLTVHVRASDKTGRRDEDFGVVSIAGLRGEARANATLKCITKAKRRVTLSIAGLGFLDETEVDDDIPIRGPAASASDTAADLDQFAAGTGEVEDFPARDIFAEAHAAAKRGTTAFREFWRSGLLPDERDVLRPGLDGYQKIAAAAVNPFDPKPAGGSFPSSQQGAPDPAPAPTAARAEPDRGARRARQQQATPAPAAEAPAEEQAPHAPLGAADDDPFGLAEVDHHMPAEPPPPQPSGLEIAAPLKNGKPDWRTWALALFGPKVRRCGTSNELADLFGANEQNLEEARATLAPADRAELERIIAEQWKRV